MIIVTGAKGVVGVPLCKRLSDENIEFIAVTRHLDQSQADKKHLTSIEWDLNATPSLNVVRYLENAHTLIHCAPIWLLAPHLESLKQTNIKRLIVFSSTSVVSKRNTRNKQEQDLVAKLSQAEKDIQCFCNAQQWCVTLFRPSMIYGYGRDQNVTHLVSFIQRFGVSLLAGKGSGLRQPVHADDLVNAVFQVMDASVSYNKIYTLAGAEVITYRQMLERIFAELNRKPRIISVPIWLMRVLLTIAANLRFFAYTPDMADRMNQDLSYDIQPAIDDFDFSPQPFLNNPARDLTR